MKILAFEIDNFMAVGHMTGSLDGKGLVLVQGDNRDDTSQNSNGAGKSSILDAICWALYGATARGESGDQIVNRTAKKGTRVRLVLDDGGTQYEVCRHRKHPKGKNRVTVVRLSDGKDLTGGTDRLTQPVIEEIVGCSLDVFAGAIYAGQENMPDLPSMTDKQLKLLIEEAAGTTRLVKAYEVANKRVSAIQKGIDSTLHEIDKKGAGKEQLEAMIEESQRRIDEFEDARKAQLKADAARLKADKARVEQLEGGLPALQEKLDKVKAGIDQVTKRIASVSTEKVELSKLRQAEREAEQEASRAHLNVDAAESRLKDAMSSLKAVDTLEGTPCGECGKTYCEDDLAQRRTIAQSAVDDGRRDHAKCVETAKHAQELLEKARQSRSEYESSMTDVSDAVTKKDKLSAAAQTIQREIDDIGFARADLDQGLKDLVELRDRKNPHLGALQTTEQRLEALNDDVAKLKASIEDEQLQLSVAKEVASLYSPAGVRAHILDTVTPFLNDRTAHYLNALSDGNLQATWSTISTTKAGELREKFAIDVTSLTGGETFKSISGGEKRKVRIATAMALQDLVASRASKPIDLFMADEIDDAVDESGLERLMGLLEEKARDRGTLLIVSHNELSDWVRDVVTVVKQGGQATLEGSALDA